MAVSSIDGAPLRAADDVLAAAYRGVKVKAGKGVEHAREVARVLGAAGCTEPVVVAGLLHDLVEDTACTAEEVQARFGVVVARLVVALTEDDRIGSYRRRKRELREQIAGAGPDAIDIALADKVASLGYALAAGARVPARKLAHYEATLALGPQAAHPEIARLAGERLAAVAARDNGTAGRG